MNTSRAVLITGPPGIGKTTSAHLVAKLEGYTPIELNASDARSKKLVEVSSTLIVHEHWYADAPPPEQYQYLQYLS